MKPNELAAALRAKTSRDNRELLDEAADVIEALFRDLREGDDCSACVHDADHCEEEVFTCRDCVNKCECHGCERGSHYEWRGVK